ncbi:MAG: heparan-alpha-glucosaminide N-acetyltransferase [Miltoncostaeaceae bacterium]
MDVARTAAIVMMVVYHAAYDIDFLAPSVAIDPFSGGWRALQVATGSSFLAIVGLSLWISNARARERGAMGWPLYRRHAVRAAQVLAAGLVVSAATFVALGETDYVRFGILHCIAVSMLLAPLVVRLRLWNLPLAALVIIVGLQIKDERFDTPEVLMFVGFRSEGSQVGVDYYPLLPWFGLVLVGLAIGSVLYPKGRRGPWGARWPKSAPALRCLGAPGRYSLPFYVVHQLVLIPLVALALLAAGVSLDTDGFR